MAQAQTQARPDTSFHRPDCLDLADANHHLWRNGRLWWVAFTVHLPGWRKDRVRLSLGTADLAEARRRRDQLLYEYPLTNDCQLSLRLPHRSTRLAAKPRMPGHSRQATVAA